MNFINPKINEVHQSPKKLITLQQKVSNDIDAHFLKIFYLTIQSSNHFGFSSKILKTQSNLILNQNEVHQTRIKGTASIPGKSNIFSTTKKTVLSFIIQQLSNVLRCNYLIIYE